MNNPYQLRRVRVAHIQMIGQIWQPNTTCAMDKQLSDYDLKNIGDFTRPNVEQWLITHSGDFRSVDDFRAVCGDTSISWASEESECTYADCMYATD